MPDERVLRSWKDIASHLDVGVRTAQDWERQRGLPVHRLPGRRGHVWVSVAELDAWKASRSPVGLEPALLAPQPADGITSVAELLPAIVERTPVPPAWRSRRLVLAVVALVVLSVWLFWLFHRPLIASVRVEEDALLALDGDGKVLWRRDFGPLNLPIYQIAERRSWVGDLDGDVSPEVLFVPVPRDRVTDPVPLICLDRRGVEQWRFVPGRSVRTANEVFAVPFVVRQFAVLPDKRILVTSHHHLWWPSQVAVLSPAGKLLREYWHSGHLNSMAVGDRNGDGRVEAYLGGVNNARGAATLVILDPDTLAGGAQEDLKYQLQDIGQPVEAARFLFPRSCMNQRLEAYNAVLELRLTGQDLTVGVGERLSTPYPPIVYYHVDTHLQVRHAAVSDVFLSTHASLTASKHLDHAWGKRELLDLQRVDQLR